MDDVRDALHVVLDGMPQERQRQVLEYAQFLASREEGQAWRDFGRAQFARVYGPDEPEYTEADLRSDSDS